MPAVETSDTLGLVLWRHSSLVKGRVRGVLELRLCKTLMVVHNPVANELDLWDSRDGLEIGMQNGFLGTLRLVVAVPIALACGVKCLGEVRH